MTGHDEALAALTGFYTGYESALINLSLYVIAILIYVLVIWEFYDKLSKKDILGKHPAQKQLGSLLSDAVKYLVAFPLISFSWFLVLSIILFFLDKSRGVEQILMTSMTLVAATRVTAYIDENMSNDFAKLIPLSLLAVFLVDPTYFTLDKVFARFVEAFTLEALILRMLVFVVLLEFVLRMLYVAYRATKTE